jgi:hypothetical protein
MVLRYLDYVNADREQTYKKKSSLTTMILYVGQENP